MRCFLAVYTLFALGIAAYAWQSGQSDPTPRNSTYILYTSPSLDDYAWLASVTVLKALPALLGLLGCAYIAARIWERLRYAQANAAGLLPIPRRYIEETPELAIEALAAYHSTERARAEHQTPARVHYAPHLRFTGAATAPALEVEGHTSAGAPTFAELLASGLVGTGQPLILGYSAGQPLMGSWKDLYSSAVAGISGSGKTTTIRFLAAQAALHGARFAILDPHADTGEESLAATLSALQPAMLCEPATVEKDMLSVVKLMQSQLDTRLAGNADRTPLLLCVDEFTRLMRSPTIAAPLAGLLESITGEWRKVGIFCTLSGQVWTSDRAGGTPLCDSLASCYVHRLRRNQARLLLSTEEARLAETLEPGRALLLRTNGDCAPVAIPLATPADVERVGALLATPAQPARNAPAIEDTAAQSPTVLSPKEAQVIAMLQGGATVPEVVKALYGTTGAAYTAGVKEVSSIISTALQQNG